jgi:hypothetical protein
MTAPLQPLKIDKALDLSFLEARGRLLEIAAIFDRFDRDSAAAPTTHAQVQKLHQAAQLLTKPDLKQRAESIQLLFSQPYDEAWKVPEPR